jgi:ABC-2 type transport system permease protein
MKAVWVARKSLIEILREPQLLALEIALPVLFLVITIASYNMPLLTTHPVLVINTDPGGTPLIDSLQAQRYTNGQPVFNITLTADQDAAEAALANHTVSALVVIAPDGSGGRLRVAIKGDALYTLFYRASTLLNNAIHRYADGVAGRPEIVRIVEQALTAAGPQNYFDAYAPGIMIMALLLIIPQTAMLVARQVRWRTLRRLRLSRLGAFDLFAGISLAQVAVALLQVVVMFLAALALGFHNQGSLLLAIVVGVAIGISAIGQGLLVAGLVENDSQAANVGATVTMLQVFLSGSFYPMPPFTVFTLAGHQIDVFDVLPATHGFLALQQVLSYGAGLSEVGFRLGATLALAALYFAAGVVVFQWLQMREKG